MCQQVAEGLLVATAHTAAHLVQVAQAEVVRLIDDDGVGIGDVDTVLHDRGSDEHIVVVVYKAHDNLFQLLGGHLSVSYAHTCIGYIACDECSQLV